MPKPQKIRCKFCPFSVPSVLRNKAGRYRMGIDVLTMHVEERHPKEAARIRRLSGRERGEMLGKVDD